MLDEIPNGGDYYRLRPYVERYPEKVECWRVFNNAMNRGELKRTPCEVCGSVYRIHGHHADYAKPLEVNWFCSRHHVEWHRVNGPGLNGGDALVRPEIFGTDIAGMRFGRLTVHGWTSAKLHHQALWDCVCDCGKHCSFTSGSLRYGRVNECPDCWRETKARGRRLRMQKLGNAHAIGMGLYSLGMIEIMERDIRNELHRALGFLPDEVVSLDGLVCRDDDFGGCGAESSDASGNDGYSLRQIGELEGVSRERIRQLEARALDKLRKAAKPLTRIGKPIEFQPPPKPVRAKIKKQRHGCKLCGGRGHNRRSCAQRKAA